MKRLPFFLFIFLSTICKSQNNFIINSILIDSVEKSPVSYANIGIAEKNVGTASSYDGSFSLAIPDSLINEGLTISRIGYSTKVFSIKDLIDNPQENLILAPVTEQLEEVKVTANKIKIKKIGYRPVRSNFGCFGGSNKGHETGSIIEIKHEGTLLKDLRFDLRTNNPDSIVFRINIYSVDNKVFTNILKDNIFVRLKKGETGEQIVDLTPYNIVVDSDILVTIEFLEIFISVSQSEYEKLDFFEQYKIDRVEICRSYHYDHEKDFIRPSQGKWKMSDNKRVSNLGVMLTVAY